MRRSLGALVSAPAMPEGRRRRRWSRASAAGSPRGLRQPRPGPARPTPGLPSPAHGHSDQRSCRHRRRPGAVAQPHRASEPPPPAPLPHGPARRRPEAAPRAGPHRLAPALLGRPMTSAARHVVPDALRSVPAPRRRSPRRARDPHPPPQRRERRVTPLPRPQGASTSSRSGSARGRSALGAPVCGLPRLRLTEQVVAPHAVKHGFYTEHSADDGHGRRHQVEQHGHHGSTVGPQSMPGNSANGLARTGWAEFASGTDPAMPALRCKGPWRRPWAPFPRGRTPRSRACAARDSNPEPAD